MVASPPHIPRSFGLYPSLYLRILNVTRAFVLHHMESEFRRMVGKRGHIAGMELTDFGQLVGADFVSETPRVRTLFGINIAKPDVTSDGFH